jgi:phosphoesterase RecJ-like protein
MATALSGFPPDLVARAREVFAALKRARRVLVTSEPYPDGDALGAELALDAIARHAFAQAPGGAGDRRVYLVNEKGCPRKYRFIAGADKVRRLDAVMERDFDLAIVVDGGAERIGAARELFDRAPVRILVDHHKFGSRERYDIALASPHASSTTQILYAFFADPEIAVPLTREAAEAIYLGLIFDTGSFQYSLTQPLSHEIAARLMETGIDFSRIHERALLTQEFEDLLVLGRVLATAQRTPSREVVWASIGLDLVEQYRPSGDDFNRIIQTLIFVEGAEVAVIFRELEPGKWKLSFRSRGKVDVAAIARELDPDGGGHDRAAGCSMDGASLAAVEERTIAFVEAKLRAAAGGAPR